MLKEYKALATSHAIKAYIRFCLDEEDSFEDEIDDCISAELAVLSHHNTCFVVHIDNGTEIGYCFV